MCPLDVICSFVAETTIVYCRYSMEMNRNRLSRVPNTQSHHIAHIVSHSLTLSLPLLLAISLGPVYPPFSRLHSLFFFPFSSSSLPPSSSSSSSSLLLFFFFFFKSVFTLSPLFHSTPPHPSSIFPPPL